jgi:hypothetical protein
MNTNNHKTAALTDIINAIQGYFSFVLGQKKLFCILIDAENVCGTERNVVVVVVVVLDVTINCNALSNITNMV